MAFETKMTESENLINLEFSQPSHVCIDSGYTSQNMYSGDVRFSSAEQIQGSFTSQGYPFMYTPRFGTPTLQYTCSQLSNSIDKNLEAFQNSKISNAANLSLYAEPLTPIVVPGAASVIHGPQSQPLITSTPRDIRQDPFDINNYKCESDSNLRRVRFSDSSFGVMNSAIGQPCQTTVSYNHLGLSGFGGQTGLISSEPRVSAFVQDACPSSIRQTSNASNLFNFDRQQLNCGGQSFLNTSTCNPPTPFYPYSYTSPLTVPPTQVCPYPCTPTSTNLDYRQTHTDRLVRREKEPDKFDGKSVELQDYLVHFEQVAAWNKWGYSEKGLQLSMSLKGPAQKLLTDLHFDQVRDYNCLKQALESRFNPNEKGFAYRCEFRTRMRKKNESPSEYGYALKRLADLAFPNVHYSGREQYTIDQFIHGLNNSELCKHVQLRHPASLAAAISYAVEYESVDQQQSASEKKPSHVRFNLDQDSECRSVLTDSQTQIKDKQLSDLLENLNSLLIKVSATTENRSRYRSPSPKPKSKIECYECHGFGHIASECKSRSRRSSSPSPNRKTSANKTKQEN